MPSTARRRETMPQIAIAPIDAGFAVTVDGTAVRHCGEELDAHHRGKHAFEAVSRGLRRPGEIERAMGPFVPDRNAQQSPQLTAVFVQAWSERPAPIGGS